MTTKITSTGQRLRIERIARRIETRKRLAELVAKEGPDSIWAELLAEAKARG